MANLNNLTSKIIEDANVEADAIMKEAKIQEEKMINISIEKAKKESANIIEKAKIDAEVKKERIISNARLKVRNNILKAKQETIDKVFQESLRRLNNLSQDQYNDFVRNYIEKLNLDGDEELICCKNSKNTVSEQLIKEINDDLAKQGKKGNVTLKTSDKNVNEGFIISKNGIEVNCTFQSLVESLRDELEKEIVAALFEK